MQKVFIITGNSVTRKLAFVKAYLKVFSKSSLLIDRRVLEKHHVSSLEISPEWREEYKQCSTLIVDDLFLLMDYYLYGQIMLDILEYRFTRCKHLLLIGYVGQYLEQFDNYQIEIIEKLYSNAQIWNMDRDTDISTLVADFFMLKYPIDTDRPLKLYLLEVNGDSMNYTDTELFLPANKWNELLQEINFLQLLEEGQLQCVAMDKNGDSFYSATVPLQRGKDYFKELIEGSNLTTSLRMILNTVLDTWSDDSIMNPHLGIDVFKKKSKVD